MLVITNTDLAQVYEYNTTATASGWRQLGPDVTGLERKCGVLAAISGDGLDTQHKKSKE